MKDVLNLMPAAILRRQLIRRRTVQWCAVLAVVLSTLWVANRFEVRKYRTLRQQLEAIAREGVPAQNMLREITTMRKQVNDLQYHEVVAHELEEQRQVLPVLGLVSQAARWSKGRLRVTDLRAGELQTVEAPTDGGKAHTGVTGVTLVGVALDSPTVAEFLEALVASRLFGDVKLIKSNEQKTGDFAMYDYEVHCDL